MLDVLEPISQLSQKFQKNLYSITRVQRDLESTISKLEDLHTSYGSKLSHFMSLAECSKNGEDIPCTIDLIEEEDATLIVTMPMRHYFDGAEPEASVIFKRKRLPLRLNAIRDFLIPALIAELRSKFPEDPQFMKALSYLEPDALPFGSRVVNLYAEKLRPVIQRFGGPDEIILREFKEALQYVIANDRDNYLTKIHTSNMPDFWEYLILKANGEGNVEVGELRPFISKIMAVAPTSVVAERGFSSFFFTKNSRRSDLSATSLQDIM
uniref:HAT C-terminal dimerisation domain-containing protein n=1 Tax=Panagrolaimus sp. ES5 TaxID=591445 RepID=A0AC34FZZ8_9BILA